MKKRKTKTHFFKTNFCFFTLLAFVSCLITSVHASETSGRIVTVSSEDGYAWSDNIGWINFDSANGNINISDTGITGYAWSSNYGWINMAPSKGGVMVDASGSLSGYAWGSNVGWINFSGVSINSSGRFLGAATGDTVGTVNFICTSCNVNTDFRPKNYRTASIGGASGGGGGGGGAVGGVGGEIETIVAPTGGFDILINDGAISTDVPSAALTLVGNGNTDLVWISDNADLSPVSQIRYVRNEPSITVPWSLSGTFGKKTVYAKFCTQGGSCSETVSSSIDYVKPGPSVPTTPAVVPTPLAAVPPTPAILTPAIPAPSPAEEQPAQLFDIRLLLDSNVVSKVSDLVARVMFTSFGRIPTPVDMKFTILDANGKEIWNGSDTTTVQTEAVFIRRFFETGELSPGKYRLGLKTIYGQNVEDSFFADFEIKSEKTAPAYWLLGLLIILPIGAFLILIRKKKDEAKKKMEI